MNETKTNNVKVLTIEELASVSGGTRRPHDHIGAFNFKVEIEGVTQGAFQNDEE